MILFLRKLGWLLRRTSKEHQLAEELQLHLEEGAYTVARRTGEIGSRVALGAQRRM
jgi:hypothetical protein